MTARRMSMLRFVLVGAGLVGCVPAEYRVVTASLDSDARDDARADEGQCERFAAHLRALTFQEIRRRADRVQEDPPPNDWAMAQADKTYDSVKALCMARGTVGEVRCAVRVPTLAELSARCD